MPTTIRRRGVFAALLIVAAAASFTVAPVAADSPATVNAGYADEPMFTGLDHPMAVAFAPGGSVFVAEKNGKILRYSSLTDSTPTLFADLSVNVHNYWDRGMMGLAVDPNFPTKPYVYVLYDYNHILGDPAAAPRWPSADTIGGSVYDDRCPNPPQATGDGCVISGRLSRLAAQSNGSWDGVEHVLIEDWCQQFPSHSLGNLAFGPEGALYVTAGDGASFNSTTPDYGEFGGSLQNTPTPVNPCGDPPGGVGVAPTPPSAEGGSLRAQDIRTRSDPTGLDGTVLRIDPATGAGWPTNANHADSEANARRIIAYGLRNPLRMTIQPGTKDVWIGDVGFNTWEEIDHLTDPSNPPTNFGWPCWEGPATLPFFSNLHVSICDNLAPAAVATPFYAYRHSAAVVTGDGCGSGSSSISGIAFVPTTSHYPAADDGALFFSDYSRRCIWEIPAGAGGQPDQSAMVRFVNLRRGDGTCPATATGDAKCGGAVFLTAGPDGDLVYVDYDRGEIRKVHYYGANVPPVARFTATPSSGAAPLVVQFDASSSSDANGDTLTYAWDLNGDGLYDDAIGRTASRTYNAVGDVPVGLKVTDPLSAASTTTHTISVGNSPPAVTIDTPSASLTWKVGDKIPFSATGTDPQDGPLPASAYSWSLNMIHCPSNCHTHIIQTFTGIKSGTFDAPDHEYPSHLELSVTVTDSGGLTASAIVELQPKTGTVSAVSSPAGIPITVGASTGAPPPSATAIVGSQIGVSAPVSAVIGEDNWSFQSWSDSGARTHGVGVSGNTAVTATFARTTFTDASDTCAGASAATSPTGAWQGGRFGKAGDVDWYRFSLKAKTSVRIVLGDLAVAGRLELYQGCSTLLQVSDSPGSHTEEIIRSLPAGTYAVRLSGSGTSSTPSYALLMKAMPNSVHILSTRAWVIGSTLRLVGEVFNNTTRTVGPVVVTARIYDASNHLLATRQATTTLPYLRVNGRSPFVISGARPTGYHHVTFTISAPATSRRLGLPLRTVVRSYRNTAGQWLLTGWASNPYTTTVTSLRLAVTLYDARGNILDAIRPSVGATTLRPGARTAVSAASTVLGLSPDRVYLGGVVFR